MYPEYYYHYHYHHHYYLHKVDKVIKVNSQDKRTHIPRKRNPVTVRDHRRCSRVASFRSTRDGRGSGGIGGGGPLDLIGR